MHPDFTGPKCVEAFVGTPVFVFHGHKDIGTPLADAERMVDALRGAGTRVTFLTEDETGHSFPGAECLRLFRVGRRSGRA